MWCLKTFENRKEKQTNHFLWFGHSTKQHAAKGALSAEFGKEKVNRELLQIEFLPFAES